MESRLIEDDKINKIKGTLIKCYFTAFGLCESHEDLRTARERKIQSERAIKDFDLFQTIAHNVSEGLRGSAPGKPVSAQFTLAVFNAITHTIMIRLMENNGKWMA